MANEFASVSPHIPCIDVWPPRSHDRASMEAYTALERHGVIEIQKVQVSRSTGMVSVLYLSACPQAWARQALGQIKRGEFKYPE